MAKENITKFMETVIIDKSLAENYLHWRKNRDMTLQPMSCWTLERFNHFLMVMWGMRQADNSVHRRTVAKI